ncbi:MAG: VWA domain-containing protein [Thermoguttaceae bacterium]|nr:VWA domain-containing protein [Thermoguttaceae bacterium]MBR4105009.1 VWA domain-containing protein [Thermoguttaceae bacterium]
MARKLPVYILIDVSGSMAGEPIQAVANGLQIFAQAIGSDPYALETAHIGVVAFASDAREIVPLTEAAQFQPPTLQASGCTELGAALRLVKQCAEKEVKKTTATEKGDWKPLVFIMTDGAPTDDWQRGLQEFKQYRWGAVVACAAGQGADVGVLSQITESVVCLDSTDAEAIKTYFKWLSASVSQGSQKVDGGQEVGGLSDLPPVPPGLSLAKP